MAKVNIKVSPTILRQKGEITIKTDSVGHALQILVDLFGSELKRNIIDDHGRLSEFIDVFVNGRNINLLDGLQTKLRDGDNINILQVVSGG